MSVILPTAPANFYAPSLNELKDSLEQKNGSTFGQITIITAAPNDANSAWTQVGAGNVGMNNTRGSLVVGQASIGKISGPLPAYTEIDNEYGYKLGFNKIPNILIEMEEESAIIVGFALIVGVDTYPDGTNNDVKYLAKIDEVLVSNEALNTTRRLSSFDSRSIAVNNGDLIQLPAWDLIINYAEPIT